MRGDKRIEDGKKTIGQFIDGKFVAEITRAVNNLPLKLYSNCEGALNGTYTVKLDDYDLRCEFRNDSIVVEQSNCLLAKRGTGETVGGELKLDKRNKQGIFITEDRSIYHIDLETKRVKRF